MRTTRKHFATGSFVSARANFTVKSTVKKCCLGAIESDRSRKVIERLEDDPVNSVYANPYRVAQVRTRHVNMRSLSNLLAVLPHLANERDSARRMVERDVVADLLQVILGLWCKVRSFTSRVLWPFWCTCELDGQAPRWRVSACAAATLGHSKRHKAGKRSHEPRQAVRDDSWGLSDRVLLERMQASDEACTVVVALCEKPCELASQTIWSANNSVICRLLSKFKSGLTVKVGDRMTKRLLPSNNVACGR